MVDIPISFMRMRQICHPLVLPILQYKKDLTTIVVRMQHLMFYHRSELSIVQIESS